MVETRASMTADQVAALLDALPDKLTAAHAFGVNDLSTFKMLEKQGEPFHVINARFTGHLPGTHEIGVRESTAILGALQEVLSEIGAAIREESPKRGPLPSSIIEATELRLSPQVQPGSVIFAMHPAHEDALIASQVSLLDQALERIFVLFDTIEMPGTMGADPGTIGDTLRDFGPRTARHLVRFAAALKDNGLNVDLGIASLGKPFREARISESGARFLHGLAEGATTRVSEVQLVGAVQNLGRDNKHKIDDDARGRIQITCSDDVTDALHTAFRRRRVNITALETQSVNSATGATTYKFEALDVDTIEES